MMKKAGLLQDLLYFNEYQDGLSKDGMPVFFFTGPKGIVCTYNARRFSATDVATPEFINLVS
jgi:hypothetical protein